MTTLAMRKPHADRGIEGMMANWYAANTAEMMKEYIDLARRIATEVPQGSAVLEVAPGPGYFCIELAKLCTRSITGLDISQTMVKIAAKKAAESSVNVGFQQGSASSIPFPAGSFDFLLCRAAFKNFAKPVDALKEMHRVLKPGGRGLIIDLKTAESSCYGALAMGISYALFEEKIFDQITGRMLNPNMEFYRLAGLNDIPELVVHMMTGKGYDERGVIGLGEPPVISPGAAISNAVANAIGVRVPFLPITPDKVLAALAQTTKAGA